MDLFGKRKNQKLQAEIADTKKQNRKLKKELAAAHDTIHEQEEFIDYQSLDITMKNYRINELEELCVVKDQIMDSTMSDGLRHGSPEAGRQMGYKSADARKKKRSKKEF